MNARVGATKSHLEAKSPVAKSPPKHGPGAFDHALDHAAPKKNPAHPDATPKDPAQERDQTKSTAHDSVREARLFAAMNGATFAPLVAATPEPVSTARVNADETVAPLAIAHAASPAHVHDGPQKSEDVTEPDASGGIDDGATQGDAALPAGMEAVDERFEADIAEKPESAADPAQAPIDPTQIAEIIASAQPVQDHQSTMKAPSEDHAAHSAPVSLAVMDGRAPMNVAEPKIAVEKTAAPQPVEWHGLAETIANGSMEGNRARVVIGQGDDRIVLTVSTHAHKVAIEVETSTQAGARLAEQLRGGSNDLNKALEKHGLELADQRASSQHQPETEREDAPMQIAPKKQTTPIMRSSGVVA